MRHLIIVIGVLLGALVSYAIGFTLGITMFVIAGAFLELAFWVFALTYSKKNTRVR